MRSGFSRADWHFGVFQHGLHDGHLSLNPHVKAGLFPFMLKIAFKGTRCLGVPPFRLSAACGIRVGRVTVSWQFTQKSKFSPRTDVSKSCVGKPRPAGNWAPIYGGVFWRHGLPKLREVPWGLSRLCFQCTTLYVISTYMSNVALCRHSCSYRICADILTCIPTYLVINTNSSLPRWRHR